MIMPRKQWFWLIALSIFSLAVWLKVTFPQFAFVNLSVTRDQALTISRDYLSRVYKVNPSEYLHATVFGASDYDDQYLQKALGFTKEIAFLKRHDFELFSWITRFFHEREKEEYFVTVSAATGQITGFSHRIKEDDSRPPRSQSESRERVLQFLRQDLGINPQDFILHSEHSMKYDNRTEYSFSWEKKDVFIRWSQEKDSGGAKILTGATISGDEILSFRKLKLKIPDQFNRFMAKYGNVSQNVEVLLRIIYFTLLSLSIFYVVVRRNDIVMHRVKRFSIILSLSLYVILLLSYFNNFNDVLFSYPTTSSLVEFFWRKIMKFLMDSFMVSISILMPCLAGETLHYEALRERKEGSFLHYLRTGIFSRNVFYSILLGYLGACIMIGIQSLAFEIGQRYCGIWIDHIWMAQATFGYLPFVTAFIIGYAASFSEEISFRIFSISLGKKFLKGTFLAVLASSLIWGFGHTSYPVYPMWFRGVEVTCLGIFLGFLYLRFGIIPVLVAHFLFDVFWASSVFLLGQTTPFHFYSSVGIILLPFFLGILATILNKPGIEQPLAWNLNPHQLYNLNILKQYLSQTSPLKNRQALRDEIISHGWDIAVVEKALEESQRDDSGT